MKRMTEPDTVVEDLVPGTEYVFRVYARNLIGMGPYSEESESVRLPKRQLVTEFSLESFDVHYELLEEIGRYTSNIEIRTEKRLEMHSVHNL